MKTELVALKGKLCTKSFQLADGRKLTLGRGVDVDIQILDSGLSRHQCAFEKKGDDFWIADLESRNGTWVNGNRLQPMQAVRLQPGDMIQVGAVEFEFRSMPDRRRVQADLIAAIPEEPAREIKESVDVADSDLMDLSTPFQTVENYQRIQRDLATIYQVGNLISGESDLESLYDRILEAILQVVKADRGFLLIADREGKLETVARRERESLPRESAECKVSDTIVEECFRERTSILRANALLDERYSLAESVISQNIHSVLCVPIETPDQVEGVIYVDTVAQSEAFARHDLELLVAISKQAGVAIQRVQLAEQLRQMLRGTARALAAAIEAKDEYTRGHSERVTSYALQIAVAMSLSDADRHTLELAGYLHDVGKIGIPENILRKAGPLSEAEYEIVKQHSRVGGDIVGNIEGAKEIAEIVRHHHERWDGKGYPDGLAKDECSLLSRILAVADAFDAMSSQRPYRDRLAQEKVIRTIREVSGKQFDPNVVEVFLKAVQEDKISSVKPERPTEGQGFTLKAHPEGTSPGAPRTAPP